MDSQSKDFLKKLLAAAAPAGFEDPATDVWKKYVEQFVSPVKSETRGSRYAIINEDAAKKILVVGHSDEIGLMVNYIDDNGFVYVAPIGGMDPMVLLSQRVRILTQNGPLFGVISKKAIHLMDRGKKDEIPKLYNLWVDIGAKDKKEAEELIQVGDPIIWGGDFEEMRNDLAVARNFDDRSGCYVSGELMRRLSEHADKGNLKVGVVGAASVCEEVGNGGAGMLAERLRPALAIAVDVNHDTNIPSVEKKRFGDIKCGLGPCLTKGVRTSRTAFALMEKAAKAKEIPYQIDIDMGRTGTDADSMYHRASGTPISLISIPCRYMHTSTEVINLEDMDKSVDILVEFVLSLDENISFGR
ncbi:MAG: hypothetical protein B6244_05635 [Candidatus Cloacimonetes bacterium 4572_55]|nr:MAG: hypothetical protein B6244_05635 [Candidatus Cloacimonetes bacterium 4572_55]